MRRIVVANDPRVYREALAGALAVHNPELRIELVEPAQLGVAVSRLEPDLVIASSLLPAGMPLNCTWVLLYPARSDYAVVYGCAGAITVMDNVTLADIVRLIDPDGPEPEGVRYSRMTISPERASA